ncbi:hexose kinase [Vagococcus sp. PNs007]|uniref:Tagatose-6-phosphate kinase n=1 Tax=Vagococcus proximus TaxID=2991417 RepID=A0ABT5X264_9ENTE|nr:hexose kinase [Vagococcus proximus]MDF0480091.1 hexose kinase [Vagococcus proximus]
MILTVTMNPSVDMMYAMDKLELDTVNRVSDVLKSAGGKGLNVTRVAHQLGSKVVATGLVGGTVGAYIEKDLNQSGINHRFSQIASESRNCLALIHEGHQTEVLEKGPTISKEEATSFLELYRDLLKQANVVTISGSLPQGLPVDFYVLLVSEAEEAGKRVLLDSSGQSLEAVLKSQSKPYMIKPNTEELEALMGVSIQTDDELKVILRDSLFEGIPLIVVSMGADGAFVKYNEIFYRVKIPKITVVNPVGSGDSTVAGMAVAISEGKDILECLKLAMTAGMLNTMEAKTGFVNPDKVDEYLDKIEVIEI